MMKITSLVTPSLVFYVFLPKCRGQGVLKGTVEDSTGASVMSAEAKLRSTTSTNELGITCDEDGYFELEVKSSNPSSCRGFCGCALELAGRPSLLLPQPDRPLHAPGWGSTSLLAAEDRGGPYAPAIEEQSEAGYN